MLATGGSASAAIQMLKDKGCRNIRFMCIIAAPEGVAKMQKDHPDVDIYIAALDEKLNDHATLCQGWEMRETGFLERNNRTDERRPAMGGKRENYISWDEYFMGVAKLSGMRSKDPNTQVGACIVSQDNKILSMGYNGFPIGCRTTSSLGERGRRLDTKYVYTVHSELNAILNYRGGSWRERKSMCPSSPATSAPRLSFRRGSARSFMRWTSIRTRPPSLLQSGCWTGRGCAITGISTPDIKLRLRCEFHRRVLQNHDIHDRAAPFFFCLKIFCL